MQVFGFTVAKFPNAETVGRQCDAIRLELAKEHERLGKIQAAFLASRAAIDASLARIGDVRDKLAAMLDA